MIPGKYSNEQPRNEFQNQLKIDKKTHLEDKQMHLENSENIQRSYVRLLTLEEFASTWFSWEFQWDHYRWVKVQQVKWIWPIPTGVLSDDFCISSKSPKTSSRQFLQNILNKSSRLSITSNSLTFVQNIDFIFTNIQKLQLIQSKNFDRQSGDLIFRYIQML